MAHWLEALGGSSPDAVPTFAKEALAHFADAAAAWTGCENAAALIWLAHRTRSADRRAQVTGLVDEITTELTSIPSSPPFRIGAPASSGPVSGWTTDPTGAASYDVVLALRQSIGQRKNDAPAYDSTLPGQRARYRELVQAKLRDLTPRVRRTLGSLT